MEFLLYSWSDKEVILDKYFRDFEVIGIENYNAFYLGNL